MRKLQFLALTTALALAPLTWDSVGVSSAQDAEEDTYKQLKLFGDVFERVRADYVEEVSDKELIEAAISGMLTHLDPHSSFLDADSFKDMQTQTRGEFGGLGIEVTMENGLVKVVAPIDDTPAFHAGIEAGDLITHLDGEAVQGLTLSEAVDRMRGPIDSEIELTILRGDQDPFEVTIVRDTITVQSVRSRIAGIIETVHVEDGDIVEKGQPLVEIERELLESSVREVQAALEEARVEHRFAKIALDRSQELEKGGAASQVATSTLHAGTHVGPHFRNSKFSSSGGTYAG